jgi:hypothetical protein
MTTINKDHHCRGRYQLLLTLTTTTIDKDQHCRGRYQSPLLLTMTAIDAINNKQ